MALIEINSSLPPLPAPPTATAQGPTGGPPAHPASPATPQHKDGEGQHRTTRPFGNTMILALFPIALMARMIEGFIRADQRSRRLNTAKAALRGFVRFKGGE